VQHIKTNFLLGIGAGIIVGYMINAATSLNRSFGFGSEPSLTETISFSFLCPSYNDCVEVLLLTTNCYYIANVHRVVNV
jgi:hypothetical protein